MFLARQKQQFCLKRQEAEGGEFWEHFALETRAVATFLQDGQSPLPSSRSATIPPNPSFQFKDSPSFGLLQPATKGVLI